MLSFNDDFLFSTLPPLDDRLPQFMDASQSSFSSSDFLRSPILSNLGSDLRPEHGISSLDTLHKSVYPVERITCSAVAGDAHMSTSEDTNDIAKKQIHNQRRSSCVTSDGDEMQSRSKRIKLDKRGEKQKIIIQVRSEEVLEDGYRWRKYGEKAMKNSSIPRSYYKCSDKKCNVKKRVERRPSESEILVVTYEGIHNHPCPNPVCYVERHVYVPIPALTKVNPTIRG
eukprot:Gb_40261 [translate_table: standard]